MQIFSLAPFEHSEHLQLGLYFTRKGEHQEMNFHDHTFSELAIILAGSNVIHYAGKQSAPLQVGDCLLLHPGLQHAYQNAGDLLIANILFDAGRLPLPGLDAAESSTFKLITLPQIGNSQRHLPIAHLADDELAEVSGLLNRLDSELKNNRPARNMIAFALFMQIIGLIVRSGKSEPLPEFRGAALKAVQYLNENFTRKITMAHLARLSGLSERDFYRKFYAATGMPPLAYKHKKQLELAHNLLQDSKLTVSEIASSCGFCDSNYLIREFSKSYGVSPGKFRKKQIK
ncbi:MAG: helix-turn-helix domain-containing protein [Lentisphaerae bacterium]|nr:helix-turn-helix domain-containing protein [Lentisphaerota bacterium]